jgi:SAM-dependent methyltransferase
MARVQRAAARTAATQRGGGLDGPDTCGPYTANEAWYLALTRRWARRLRAGGEAGVCHDPRPDVDFAERVLGIAPPARVLDLAAGWGRTSIELLRRGYEVVAFDLSPELVALGQERAAALGLPLPFLQGSVRCLPDLGRFDAVCAFYDDCPLAGASEAENRAALQRIAAALRPGGGLLFGTTDCARVLPPLQRSMRRDGDETIEETISFDAETCTGISVRVHRHDDGRTERYVRRRRHYSLAEARLLLAAAGLELTGAWCAYDEALPYGARPEGIVLAAQREC